VLVGTPVSVALISQVSKRIFREAGLCMVLDQYTLLFLVTLPSDVTRSNLFLFHRGCGQVPSGSLHWAHSGLEVLGLLLKNRYAKLSSDRFVKRTSTIQTSCFHMLLGSIVELGSTSPSC